MVSFAYSIPENYNEQFDVSGKNCYMKLLKFVVLKFHF
jgi:hypothetical protein